MITENELKKIFANNLIYYRKQNGLTQLQLAEKLNYTDKAISKWERADSFPDLYVIKTMAEILGVTINDLISEQKVRVTHKRKITRFLIPALAVSIVWIIATAIYVFFKIFLPINNLWLSFIYAIPASLLILLIFSYIWKANLMQFIFLSCFCWSVPLSIYLSLSIEKIWLLFLCCIPIQILIFFWFILLKKLKN